MTDDTQLPADEEQDILQDSSADIEALQDECDRLKDLAARAQADLQNAKIRMQREAEDLRKYALEGLVMQLLPTVDNFQRAFAHLPEDLAQHDWAKGVQAVEQDFIRVLTAAGLSKIESMGQAVDPHKHEVLQTENKEKDVITQVFEEGYEYAGKVLRPAKVQVGTGE